MSHASTAAKVRAEKEAHPERFCPNQKCLFRTTNRTGEHKACPKHTVKFNPALWVTEV